MTIRQPSDLKAFFETGDRPTQAQFSDLIDSSAPDHFTTVAALLADTTASYPTGMTLTAAGYRYTVAASGASDHHLTNAGGAKLYFQRAGIRVSPEAFGAAGDGSTDDIAALELWRDYVEPRGLIGAFDARTYVVSRTLYLVAVASYEGCEGTMLKATAGFATTFVDPERNHLAAGLAPVVFFDGRIEATGAPNRRVGLSGFAIDANSVAAHGLIATGVGAGRLSDIYVDNPTVSHFVVSGVQNNVVSNLKAIGGSSGSLPSEANLWIMNGAKNMLFVSCDVASGQDTTPGLLRIGANSSYPGPGNSASPIAGAPSRLLFHKGVLETQGNSEEPLRAIYIEGGSDFLFYGINLAGAYGTASAEIVSGVTSVHFDGGGSNGLSGTQPVLITEGRDTVMRGFSVQNHTGTSGIFVVNGNGRIEVHPPDNGFFPGSNPIFQGTAAHYQKVFRPLRVYGDDAAKTDERADQSTGTPWWDSARNRMTWWVNGAALDAMGRALSSGTSDDKNCPVLGDADVSAGVLDLHGYERVTLSLSGATSITGMTALGAGREVTIILDNGNATFTSASGLKLTDRAPSVNPQARDTITFIRANGSNLTGGTSEWLQKSGPIGLATGTTTNLSTASNALNTTGKRAGKFCRNTTDGKLYVATGASTTSTWVSADGATTVTPA